MDKNKVMAMLDSKIDVKSMSLSGEYSVEGDHSLSCWGYWHEHYYPQIIKESYPIYVGERAKDKGKQAFEIIKSMMDKKFLKLETVRDFIDVMDLLIATL